MGRGKETDHLCWFQCAVNSALIRGGSGWWNAEENSWKEGGKGGHAWLLWADARKERNGRAMRAMVIAVWDNMF